MSNFFKNEKIKFLVIFENKVTNTIFLCINIIIFSFTIVLSQMKILHVTTNSFLLDASQIATNSSEFLVRGADIIGLAKNLPVALFFELFLIIFLLNLVFSRFFPRKTGLTSIYLAVRTIIHLLITGTSLKFSMISIWNAVPVSEAIYSIEVIFSRTYLLLILIVALLLLFQGLFLLFIPTKSFMNRDNNQIPFSKESVDVIKYYMILMPVTLFISGDGNMVIFSYLFALNKKTNSQPVLSAYYVFTSYAFILLFFIMFTHIKEPFNFSRKEDFKYSKKKFLLFLSLGVILWLFYFFYGSLFLLEGNLNIEILVKLFQVEFESFLLFFITILALKYIQKLKKKDKRHTNSHDRLNEVSEKRNFSKKLSIQIANYFLLTLILCSSFFALPLFVNLSDFYSLESKIGLDMQIERECLITEANFLSNGTFNFKVSIAINFSNVPLEAQGSLIYIKSLVVDTDNNSFYDSYYSINNISIFNSSDTITTYIGSPRNGRSIIIIGYGNFEIIGSINQTFTVGEQITFVFANRYTENYFSVVFVPYTTTIIPN